MQINIENYGVDWDGPVPAEIGEDNHVEVPDTTFPLNMEHFHELERRINPLRHSSHHGVDCYMDVLQFISSTTEELQYQPN